MKKLNNKGITTVEVIVCFVLIVTITTALYNTVSAFNEKRILEQNKEAVYTYKNLLTKDIQEDFIKIGIVSASTKTNISPDGSKVIDSVECIMKDGTKRQLLIIRQYAKSPEHPGGSTTEDDYYMIEYGTPDNDFIDINQNPLPTNSNVMEYPIPKLGSTKYEGRVVQDLSIRNVKTKVTNNNVLDVYIGFYHPELTTRYGVQIISPINYVSSTNEITERWTLYSH